MLVCRFYPPVFAGAIAFIAIFLSAFSAPPQNKPVAAATKTPALPPLPPGVAALKFSSFFVTPVGPQGLELTPEIKNLNNKRVRLMGFMVKREQPEPGIFLLTARPETMDEDEAGYSELPSEYVRVLVPGAQNRQVAYTPKPFLVTGTLSVGNREERDGSVSLIRLTLDPVFTKKPAPKSAQAARKK